MDALFGGPGVNDFGAGGPGPGAFCEAATIENIGLGCERFV